jgi:hypothetical protein
VGAAPRGPGEQRADLIRKNGPIFVGQGKAIAKNAASDVRVLVVGNPCNTNCLIAYRNGKDVPADRWHAMTRLDHNRAIFALAAKAGVENDAVTCMTIWGNHSNTQYPDFTNAKITGKPATSVITDRGWLENTFVPANQDRGKFIIDTTADMLEGKNADETKEARILVDNARRMFEQENFSESLRYAMKARRLLDSEKETTIPASKNREATERIAKVVELPAEKKCPSCSSQISSDDLFCRKCGAKV